MTVKYIKYRCPGCGSPGLVLQDFKPVHFSGRLAPLSEGYCTPNCARATLNRLLIQSIRNRGN